MNFKSCNLESMYPMNPAHKPAWYLVPVRVLLVTLMLTLLSFAVSLFLGILGTVIAGTLRGVRPNMAFAYRHIALPVAITAAVIILVSAFIVEIRQYRRARTLSQIERQMSHAS
jgi:ABC-type dipeptide/oligopeptide/nickel transport system permease component